MKEIMMLPGPTEVAMRVIQAACRPAISHLDVRFIAVMDETCCLLRKVFQTQSEIIPLVCSGRGGIEAALASSLEPGEKMLVISNGIFGRMMADIAKRLGIVPVVVESKLNEKLNIQDVENRLADLEIKAIGAVHCESSTGVLNPVSEIGRLAHKHNLIFILDCVSSLGGVDFRPDEIHADICITGSQKCLGSLPGLALLSVSNRMWDVFERRISPITSFYFDLSRWRQMWIPKERGGKVMFGYRRQPITMATHLIYCLHEALKMIMEEGLDNRFKRHQLAAQAVREAVQAIGLEMFPEKGIESPTISAIYPPEGIPEAELRRILREEHGIYIAGGLEELSGKIFRIGHMANTASPACVMPTICALEFALKKIGYDVKIGKGMEAAMEIFGSNN